MKIQFKSDKYVVKKESSGFGWITNVKPMTGWNTSYNKEHKIRDPFIFRNR